MDQTGQIIAYCGLVCSDCEAFIATQSGDQSTLEQVAKKWKEAFNLEEMSSKDVSCDGCLSEQGRKVSYCLQCEIRACGHARGALNCAYCSDYACEKLEGFFANVTNTRGMLDKIRVSLQS